MNRVTWIATAVVAAAVVALFLVARLRYSGTAPARLPAGDCDSSLWQHVYDRERLRVIEECTVVEGRVASIRRAADGDLHIGLDPDNQSVLNLFNVIHGRSELVVEIICEHSPAKAAQKSACAGYHPSITIPKVHDRVRVTGAYVTDYGNGWNEIHPVTRIESLR